MMYFCFMVFDGLRYKLHPDPCHGNDSMQQKFATKSFIQCWLFMTKSFLQLKELLYFCRSMAGVLRLWCLPLECHVDFGFGTFHAATLGTSILDKTTEMSFKW